MKRVEHLHLKPRQKLQDQAIHRRCGVWLMTIKMSLQTRKPKVSKQWPVPFAIIILRITVRH